MDWVRFASLQDEWPAAYGAFDCEQLDPSDADQRSIGLEAAHAHFQDALQDDTTMLIGDEEMSPGLHLATHEAVAEQLINGNEAVRATAERLLEEGFEPHDVLHMLGSVFAEHMRLAMIEGEPRSTEEYEAALDALPDSWLELAPEPHFLDDEYADAFVQYRDDIEDLLQTNGAMSSAALAALLEPDGDLDPRALALYLHYHEDFAHLLADGTVALERDVLRGVVMLHRLSSVERTVERLDIHDLPLVLVIDHLDGKDPGIPLAAGGSLSLGHREAVDGPERTRAEDGPPVWTLDGPPGWLDPVAEADVVALRWDGDVLHVEPSAVDEVAATRAAHALATAFADRDTGDPDLTHGDGDAIEVADLLLDVLVSSPDALRRPTELVSELVTRAGLSQRGDYVAPGGFDWDEHDRQRKERYTDVAIYRAGVDRADLEEARRTIAHLEAWMDGEDASGRELQRVGDALLLPGVAAAAYTVLGGSRRTGELLAVSERVVSACGGRADGGAHFLAARCAEHLRDGAAASEHLRLALAGGLDDPEAFEMASIYVLWSGDLARAAHLAELAEIIGDDDDLDAYLVPYLERAGRNEPCPCLSGRKFKHCHGSPVGPPRPPSEQAELLHFKLTLLAERVDPMRMLAAVSHLGWEVGGPEPPLVVYRFADDLALFEGGLLDELLTGWGSLLPPAEREVVSRWPGARLSVVDGEVTRFLPLADGTTWRLWTRAIGDADPVELAASLASGDHLAVAAVLAPLFA